MPSDLEPLGRAAHHPLLTIGACLPSYRGVGSSGGWARVLAVTSEHSRQPAVASRLARLVERVMTLAVEERDDDLAVARLAWLAHTDQAALAEAGQVCLGHPEAGLVVGGWAAGLLARVGGHDRAGRPPGTPR
jgi:hypothetical protein